jgi:hypothetical protein
MTPGSSARDVAAPARPVPEAGVTTGAGGARVTVAQGAVAALGWIVLVGLTTAVVVAADPSHVRLTAAAVIAMVIAP